MEEIKKTFLYTKDKEITKTKSVYVLCENLENITGDDVQKNIVYIYVRLSYKDYGTTQKIILFKTDSKIKNSISLSSDMFVTLNHMVIDPSGVKDTMWFVLNELKSNKNHYKKTLVNGLRKDIVKAKDKVFKANTMLANYEITLDELQN